MWLKLSKEIAKYLIICLLCIMVLFPLYYLLLYALMSDRSILDNKIFLLIKEWNWSNFSNLFAKPFFIALAYTLVFSTILILLRIITYSLAIAGLLKMKEIYQKIFQYFFLMISLIPEFSIYLSLKFVLLKLDLVATVFAFVTNSIFSFFTFTYIFNIAKHTSAEKEKIMLNDNLKWFDKLIYVYLPKLKLAYFLLIIFSFVSVWNDYLWPLYILTEDYSNLTIWYLNLGHEPGFVKYNIQAAGALISVLIPLIIYFAFSKKIRRFN